MTPPSSGAHGAADARRLVSMTRTRRSAPDGPARELRRVAGELRDVSTGGPVRRRRGDNRGGQGGVGSIYAEALRAADPRCGKGGVGKTTCSAALAARARPQATRPSSSPRSGTSRRRVRRAITMTTAAVRAGPTVAAARRAELRGDTVPRAAARPLMAILDAGNVLSYATLRFVERLPPGATAIGRARA